MVAEGVDNSDIVTAEDDNRDDVAAVVDKDDGAVVVVAAAPNCHASNTVDAVDFHDVEDTKWEVAHHLVSSVDEARSRDGTHDDGNLADAAVGGMGDSCLVVATTTSDDVMEAMMMTSAVYFLMLTRSERLILLLQISRWDSC